MKKPAQDAKTAADPTERQTRADPTDPAERRPSRPSPDAFFLGYLHLFSHIGQCGY